MHDAQSIRRNSNLERAVSPLGELHTARSERHFEQPSRRVSSPFVAADDQSSMLNHKCDGGEVSQNSDDLLRPPKKTKKPHRAPVSPFAIGKITKARKEAKRQAALILLAYIVCWSPYNILSIVHLLGLFYAPQYLFVNALISINPILNPIIYGVFKKAHF